MIKFNSIFSYYAFRSILGLGNFILIYIFFTDSREILIKFTYLIQLYIIISEGLISNLYSKTDRFSVKSIMNFSMKYRLIFMIPLSLVLTLCYPEMNIIYILLFFLIGFTNYENFIQFIDLNEDKFKELIMYRVIAVIIAIAILLILHDIVIYYTAFILLTNLSSIKPIIEKVRCPQNSCKKDRIKLNLFPIAQSLVTYSYTSLLILSNTNLAGWANFGLVDKIYNSAINFLSPLKFAQGINFLTKSESEITKIVLGLSTVVLFAMLGVELFSFLVDSEINFQGYLYLYLFFMCFMGLVIPQLYFKLNYYNKERLLFLFISAVGIINIPLSLTEIQLPLRLIINSLFILTCLLVSSYRLNE